MGTGKLLYRLTVMGHLQLIQGRQSVSFCSPRLRVAIDLTSMRLWTILVQKLFEL